MTIFPNMKLKTKALLTTAAILLAVLGVNTALNIYSATSKYEEALLTRAAVMADAVKKDIEKALAFGLTIDALSGTGERLKEITEQDRDLSRIVVQDKAGKVLYTSDSRLLGRVLSDAATRDALAATAPFVQSYRDEAGGQLEKVIPLSGVDT